MVTRKIAFESTLPLRSDGAARRVEEGIECGFPLQDGSRLGDSLACPSRDPDGFGPRGSSARILP